jgi:hypothetical protein
MGGRDEKYIFRFQSRNMNGRDGFKDLGIDGRVILKYTLKKRMWTAVICLGIGSS